MVLPIAAFFAGVAIFAAEVDAFFAAGVLVFLDFATAAGVFFPATFFAEDFIADLAVLGVLETELPVLAFAPATFLEADFVF